MPNTVQHPVRKSRLSLTLKTSNDQSIAIKYNASNEKVNKLNSGSEIAVTSSNNRTMINDENEEEEINTPCSEIEDNLVFSQTSVSEKCDKAQVSIVQEQESEISTSIETYFSLELDKSRYTDESEDIVNKIEDDNSTDIYNSSETKISKILNEKKDSETTTEFFSADIMEKDMNQNNSSEISSSVEVDVCKIFDKEKGNEKMECSDINEERVNFQEECNEIPNSPEAKILKILKENKGTEESKDSEKKYNDLPPIIKRNIVIADSDEEFEEFANQKRKLQKKLQNTDTSNSQKENSTSKCQEQTKVSSSSSKKNSKVLKHRRDKSNVSKTSKEKSKSVALKRKFESVVENSDDEFEKPYKQVKQIQSPQIVNNNKEVKKSKKLKKSR